MLLALISIFKGGRAGIKLFAVGFLLGAVSADLFAAFFPSGEYSGYIEGRITDASYSDKRGFLTLTEGGYSMELENICVNREKIFGKASLFYVPGAEMQLQVGDRIAFFGSVTGEEFQAGEYSSSVAAKYGVYYTAFEKGAALEVSKGGFAAVESIRFAVKDALYTNCREETASFLFAMIFGDTSYMEYAVSQPFRDTGTAHLFAVSGLHVALLFYACAAVLNKIHMPKALHVAAELFIMVGYSALCSFSPSVVRSAVMIMTASLCKYMNLRYDALSAFGFSACAILLFAPFFLYDAGFLMSYGSVFGILGTARPVARTLRKVIWRPAADTVAVSLAANFGLLPFMLCYFGSVPALTIPVNLIIVPLTSAFYPLLLAATVIAAILPPAGILLTAASVPTYFAILFVQAAAQFTSLSLTATFTPLLCVLYYPLLACASVYCRAPASVKKGCGYACLALVIFSCFVTLPF